MGAKFTVPGNFSNLRDIFDMESIEYRPNTCNLGNFMGVTPVI